MPRIENDSLVIELQIAEQLGIPQMLEQAGIPVENTQNPQVEQPPMPGQEQMGGGGGMPATGMESITAMLRTVLQNQMEIMKALNIGNHEIISAEINRLLQENLAIVDGDLKRQVPEGQYIQFPKN